MKQLAIWLRQGIIHILAAFKLKSSVVTTPEVSTTKPQKVKEMMNHPDVQRIRNEMIVKQGNEFLDLVAIQYQIQKLDTGQRMILGMAMETTAKQMKQAQQQLKTLN